MHSALVKRTIPMILFTVLLSGCNGWVIQPLPNPTPLQASPTPSIYSPTPAVIGVTPASATPGVPTATFLPTSTNIASPTATTVPINTFTATSSVSAPALQIIVIGCNTSIDITHSMGEVTNAFVTLKNTGNVELTNLVTTLYALDEDREHPDKVLETASIPVGFEVKLKLTVDSSYKEETPIQVEVHSDQGLFPREGSGSCLDLGLLPPNTNGLNTPVPSNP